MENHGQQKMMKLYKVIKNGHAKDGGNFDYSKYLPKKNKPGKWTPKIKNPKMCSKGYHLTPYWNMFYCEGATIYEAKGKGIQPENNETGVIDKYVCKSIRLLKEVAFKFDKKSNTGDCNTGNRNTGYYNTGNRNTGYCNTGNRNTGYYNTGNRNTGNRNTGNRNTGNRNTGNCNTGYYNTGDWNTGDCNTGNRNTGNWNVCDHETGYFNTKEGETIRVFNKPCKREKWENANKPIFIYFDIDKNYKKSFQKSFKEATPEDVRKLLRLPNFDYKIFEKISGISKAMIQRKLK